MVTKPTDEEIREVTQYLSVIFKIKCSKEDNDYFDLKCKEEWGDSRHVMLKFLLTEHESITPRLDKIEEKLELLNHLANKVFELEEKMNKKKVKKMNDGTEVRLK